MSRRSLAIAGARPDCRLPHARRREQARGMAVITALLVVMVATMLVTGLLQRQANDVRAVENALSRSQARQLILAGLDWSRAVLAADGRRFAVTRPDQLWAVPVEETRLTQGDDDRVAVFSGGIDDAQARFNLTNLAVDGEPDVLAVQRLERLLTLRGQPPGPALRIAQRIALAQPNPRADPVRPALTPMLTDVDHVADVEGVTPQLIEALRAVAVVLPEATRLNVNTALPEVIAATVPNLSLGAARALTAQRDRGAWFNDAADFMNRLGPEYQELTSDAFVVNSHWFLVKGAITFERAVIGTTALVHRGNAASPEIVWIRESH